MQGASTIEQQFIKNALQAQSHRTIFEKLREAALAFQLSHKWSKEKIITAYLNTIYFGNGAYGIEAAAQTYFGHDVNHLGCGDAQPRAVRATAAAVGGRAARRRSSSRRPPMTPPTHPVAARARRDIVLRQMLEQGYLTRTVYEQSIAQALPAAKDIQAPQRADDRRRRRRLLHELGAAAGDRTLRRRRAPSTAACGSRRRSTSNCSARPNRRSTPTSPTPAGRPPRSWRSKTPPARCARWSAGATTTRAPSTSPPRASASPAPRSRRSTSRPRCEDGISPDSTWTSKQKTFIVPNTRRPGKVRRAQRRRRLHRLQHAHRRHRLLRQLDLRRSRAEGRHPPDRAPGPPDGHHHAAVDQPRDDDRRAHGRRHAARHGPRLRDDRPRRAARQRHAGRTTARPVGIQEVDAGSRTLPDGNHQRRQPRQDQAACCPPSVAATETSMLETVLQYGTGRAAAIGQFAAGKTGTTSNYGDAWFVGWDSKYTVAVWVGYPDSLVPMTTAVQRRPGARRHLPGADLARLHDLRAARSTRTAPNSAAAQGAAGEAGEGQRDERSEEALRARRRARLQLRADRRRRARRRQRLARPSAGGAAGTGNSGAGAAAPNKPAAAGRPNAARRRPTPAPPRRRPPRRPAASARRLAPARRRAAAGGAAPAR